MFHQEFYPTPPEVISQMQFDPKGKIILEPHAGKGNIVDYCLKNHAKEVLTMEINEDLQKIVRSKSKFIGNDFFECKPDMISHVNQIIMNPPFSNAEKHILHAWHITPDGCEIYALCNYSLIENNYNRQLKVIIEQFGITENLEDCFADAERKTNVKVGLVKLFKPINSEDFSFDGFFLEEDEEEANQQTGLMQYNEVRALVNRYVGAMKAFDTMKYQVDLVNNMTKDINMSSISLEIGHNKTITNKKDFSKALQKASWDHIFNKLNMDKYVTSGVMKNVNKFVETQEKVPFTMKNIYKMLEIIFGTRKDTFNQALIEAIDNFTKFHHENRFGVEGWKTNSGYMLNKKFIVEGVMETQSFMGFRPRYDSFATRRIDDLVKVLCNITGLDFDFIGSIYNQGRDYSEAEKLKGIVKIEKFEPNVWYDWGFFEIKAFKKGTMHFKFKNINDWYLLNKAYGELKGFTLSETYKKK